MSDGPLAPRARIVLRFADCSEVCLGPIESSEACDLALVDRVLRMRLDAVREGRSVILRDVSPELTALLDLVGVRELLAPRSGGLLDPRRQAELGEELG